MKERLYSDQNVKFNNNYLEGDSYALIIEELGNENKEWKKVLATITHLKNDGNVVSCNEKVALFIQTINDSLKIGDRLALNTPLVNIKNKGNPGEFDSEFFYKSKGIQRIGFVSNHTYIKLGNEISGFVKWALRSRDYLGGILEKHLSGQELALAQALILGDRSFLDPETTMAFGNSGAMHVLAVSGLHIGIILQFILYLLKRFSKVLSRQKALIIALILLWIYTVISGLSASVLRATFMFSVLAISQLYGKNYNPINSLFFTCFVLLLLNPLFLFDIGFQLSFLAMIGIFWFYKPVSNWFYIKNKWLRKVWEGTAVGIAAQFVTVPLTLYYFHQFPNYFILTNIGLMFCTGLILGLGMFVFAFSWVKFVGYLAVFLLSLVLLLTLKFVIYIDDLPGSVASGFQLNWLIVLFAFVIIVFIHLFCWLGERYKVGLFIVAFLLVFVVVFQRFNQLIYSEICFFNHSKATFTIKLKDQMICFYSGTEKDLKKIKFMIDSYKKSYPCEVNYLSLNERDWKIKKKYIVIFVNNLKNGIQLQINDKKYFLRKREEYAKFKENRELIEFNPHTVICMPWIIPKGDEEYSLKCHAVRFKI